MSGKHHAEKPNLVGAAKLLLGPKREPWIASLPLIAFAGILWLAHAVIVLFEARPLRRLLGKKAPPLELAETPSK